MQCGTSPKGTDVPQGAGMQEIIEGTYGLPSEKALATIHTILVRTILGSDPGVGRLGFNKIIVHVWMAVGRVTK